MSHHIIKFRVWSFVGEKLLYKTWSSKRYNVTRSASVAILLLFLIRKATKPALNLCMQALTEIRGNKTPAKALTQPARYGITIGFKQPRATEAY